MIAARMSPTLLAHIASGSAGLLLGPAILGTEKGSPAHLRLGAAYLSALVSVTVTGCAMWLRLGSPVMALFALHALYPGLRGMRSHRIAKDGPGAFDFGVGAGVVLLGLLEAFAGPARERVLPPAFAAAAGFATAAVGIPHFLSLTPRFRIRDPRIPHMAWLSASYLGMLLSFSSITLRRLPAALRMGGPLAIVIPTGLWWLARLRSIPAAQSGRIAP
jgi:hypothetical protein